MRVVFVLKLNFFQYSGHPGPLYSGYPPSPYFSYEKITHTLPSYQFPVRKEEQAAEKMKDNPMVNKAVLVAPNLFRADCIQMSAMEIDQTEDKGIFCCNGNVILSKYTTQSLFLSTNITRQDADFEVLQMSASLPQPFPTTSTKISSPLWKLPMLMTFNMLSARFGGGHQEDHHSHQSKRPREARGCCHGLLCSVVRVSR
jgi:hypothetical protein